MKPYSEPSECSICGSQDFLPVGTRHGFRCAGCKSVERTRYQWLYLLQILKPGMRVLHVAPEPATSRKIQDIVGPTYMPRDFEPARWKIEGVEVGFIDLTATEEIESNYFDLVMHLHVLEHLPVPLNGIFQETMRILKPGGRFVFALPIASGITYENTWPYANKEQRKARFGQHDHVRLAGRDDFPLFLRDVLAPWSSQTDFRVDPEKFWTLDDFVAKTGIPYERVMGYTGATIFSVQKRLELRRNSALNAPETLE